MGRAFYTFSLLPGLGLQASWSKFKFCLSPPPRPSPTYLSKSARQPPLGHTVLLPLPRGAHRCLKLLLFFPLFPEPSSPLRCQLQKRKDPVCLVRWCSCSEQVLSKVAESTAHTHFDTELQLPTALAASHTTPAAAASWEPTPWANLLLVHCRPQPALNFTPSSPEAVGTLLSEPSVSHPSSGFSLHSGEGSWPPLPPQCLGAA